MIDLQKTAFRTAAWIIRELQRDLRIEMIPNELLDKMFEGDEEAKLEVAVICTKYLVEHPISALDTSNPIPEEESKAHTEWAFREFMLFTMVHPRNMVKPDTMRHVNGAILHHYSELFRESIGDPDRGDFVSEKLNNMLDAVANELLVLFLVEPDTLDKSDFIKRIKEIVRRH